MRFGHRRSSGDADGAAWRRRPALSRSLRLAIFVGPVSASLLIAILLSHLLPRASGPLTATLWIAVVAGGSLLTLVVFERAARRLLPLAALLNVSLLFPDKAPARFAVARRSGNPRQLREQLLRARSEGRQDDALGMQTVIELVLALSVHDKRTRGHSERVRVFADMIADELKIEEGGQARLRWAALLHDVGKLEISPSLLNKPGKPDDEEWKVLHRHPEEGARLVAPLLGWLDEWGRAVVEHHERWDGTGYPHQLKGHDISLAARIVAVADVYEVMTSPRPYKRSMTIAAARQELTRVAGTQLDPAIVRAFLNISIGRLWRTIGFGAWIGQIPSLGRVWSAFGGVGTWAGSGALSAVTATVLSVGGFASPIPSPSGSNLFSHPGSGAQASLPALPVQPSASPAPTGLPQVSDSGAQAIPAPPPVRAGHAPTAPSPTPTSRSTPTPKPTPTPTPTPTPNPWSCSTCLDTSPSCVSHCANHSLPHCTTYCEGNNNSHCVTSCFGASNPNCVQYCVGPNNPKCQTDCRVSLSFVATEAILRSMPPSGGLVSSSLRGQTAAQTSTSSRSQKLINFLD